MYNPNHFKKDDLTKLHDFVHNFNFATVISSQDGNTTASHLPLLVDRSRGKYGTLIGHFAKANPQWKTFQNESTVFCVFNGPHGYISPTWYKDPLNVPTWNYAVVHVYGKPSIIDDPRKVESILQGLVDRHETQFKDPWKYNLPTEFRDKLVNAIVGFEIEVHSIEGKFKLSQNRSKNDWESAVHGAKKHYQHSNPDLVKMMQIEFDRAQK